MADTVVISGPGLGGQFKLQQWGISLLVAVFLHGGGSWWLLSSRGVTQPPQPLPTFNMVMLAPVVVPVEPIPVEEPVAPVPAEEPPPPPAPLPKVEAAPPLPKPVAKPKSRRLPQRSAAKTVVPAPQTTSANAFTPVAAAPVLEPPHTRAAYLNNPKPAYPMVARRQGWEGLVLLTVAVSPAGEAVAVTVKRGSGYPLLDKVAWQTVSQWRFVPARRGDVVEAAEVEIPIRFSLKDS